MDVFGMMLLAGADSAA